MNFIFWIVSAVVVLGPPAAAPREVRTNAPSKYPLVYPVSDQTRSVVRSVREQIGLTAQHMQALGCDYETSLRVFRALTDWAEPRRAELDAVRREYAAARAAYLADEGAMFVLRGQQTTNGAAEAHERLAQAIAERAARLSASQARYEEVSARYDALLALVQERIAEILTPAQLRQWRAARENAPRGTPMSLWFVPELADEQRRRLCAGEPAAAVLNAEQQTIAAETGESYRACAADVQRAELKFFFGRDTAGDQAARPAAPAAPSKSPPPECPYHQAAARDR